MILLILSGLINTRYSLYSNPENLINEIDISYKIEKFNYISEFALYNDDFGIKKLSFILDSLKFAKKIYLGDYGNLRGFTLENVPIILNPTFRIGKEKDMVGKYFPYFKDNIFLFGITGKNNFMNSEFVYRGDKSRYSPAEINTVLRNTLNFKRGNLLNKFSFAIGSYSYDSKTNLGYDLEYTFDYKRERFGQLLKIREIKMGFVNESNQYFKDGRFEIYSITGYTYPFGWGFRYGFYFYGPKDGITRRFFLNTDYRYRNFLLNLFGNLEFKEIDFRNIYRGINLVYNYRSFSTSLNYYYNRIGYLSEIFDWNIRFSPVSNAYYYFNIRRELGNRFYTFSGINLPFGVNTRINFEFSTLFNNLYFRNNLTYRPSKNLEILTGMTYNLNDNRYTFNFEISSCFKTEDIGLTGVYGKVYYDKNNNNIFDGEDECIKETVVIIDDIIKVNVDKNGNYRYYFLPTGEHKIKIRLKNLPTYIGIPKYEYSFNTENMKFINIDFPLKGLGGISGKIFFDKNGNSIYDEDEEGIPNIIVKIDGADIFTLSDANGNYRIDNLPVGFYTLKLNNIPNGYVINPPDLLIYVYIKEQLEHIVLNLGLIETKKKIRIKKF